MAGIAPDGPPAGAPADTTVHIINHTHWDREWFLTHEYTTAWIPDLIDSLVDRAAANDGYEYLFDGQTLVIEDLMNTAPDYRATVEELIAKQHLRIGPVYSQPDWRMMSGQLHVRNLVFGTDDAAEFGGTADVAWLVDTFGHISQAPQLLSLVGVDAAFVWRGVPRMLPVFNWEAPNGSTVTTVDLFGGYRNLYGVTKTPGIAVDRLVAETTKLRPHYGDIPIPLFDGYDLDTDPEDPAHYYQEVGGVPSWLDLQPSSPRTYIEAVTGGNGIGTPGGRETIITGELLSGRFGATFPGTLSTRTYLKVLHHDAEHALQLRAEPLAVLAAARGATYPADRFEQASRELLQNGVHDCICGVSIDQVHERMDRSYRRLLAEAEASAVASTSAILQGFAPGTYAVSTVANPGRRLVRVAERVIEAVSDGVGVTPVAATHEIRRVEESQDTIEWTNEHYTLVVTEDGITVDGRAAFRPVVRADAGDTYSSEPTAVLGTCAPVGLPVIASASDVDTEIRIPVAYADDARTIRATIHLRVDDGPVIESTIDLDSDGTGYRLDLEFDTGVEADTALAAMPFDLVERGHVDTDLFETAIDDELAGLLMGQREVGKVDEFPFQDLVALRGSAGTRAVLAKGIRSYGSSPTGLLSIALRRSIEWLARTGLPHRDGDAGPAMYVPGARAERTIRHELAYAVLPADTTNSDLYVIADGFHTPPLIAEVIDGPTDGPTSWTVFRESLPTAGIELLGDQAVVRMFNPEETGRTLSDSRNRVSVKGLDLGQVSEIWPKEILSVAIEVEPPQPLADTGTVGAIHGLTAPRVGPSRSRPDDAVIAEMEQRAATLAAERVEVEAALETATGSDVYRLTHRHHVLAREEAEIALSAELNRRLAVSEEIVSIPDQPDEVIAALGVHLNDLRVKRRIYDYVVQSL